ncbi:MAG: TrmH family RNA methyltransferase [Phycisphaerales bacterium]
MNTETINTLDDPRVALYRNVRDCDLRGGGGRAQLGSTNKHFIAESEHVIRRLLQSGRFAVTSLFLTQARLAQLAPDIHADHTFPIYVARDEALMREISGYRHHGGALAIGDRPAHEHASNVTEWIRAIDRVSGDGPRTLLLAHRLSNVDNVGSLLRNAAALGADGVIQCGCADPLFRRAIRVSMGHVFTVPWIMLPADAVRAAMSDLAACQVAVVAAETGMSGRSNWRDLATFSWPDRVAILLGSEGGGLDAQLCEASDCVLEVPMARGIASINVATAAAILLAERQRLLRTRIEE